MLLAMAAVVAALASAACDLGTVTVPRTQASVVVHAVLNPSAINQLVLVERTLTGAVTIPDTGFDSVDPIVTAGGIPVSGATVEIIDSTGKVYRGVETSTLNPLAKGAGVYQVPLSGASLVLGGRYRLHIVTTAGEDVTGSTRIPRAAVRSSGGITRTLNRDHDVALVQWSPVPDASSYFVRIESPFGPFFLFTDSTRFRLSGELRNLFSNDLQRVLIPGFRQNMIVAAVDSNFYDYYRTQNDPFTGSGIINRLTGGIGLFGSLVTVASGTVTVTADQTDPVEGRFRLVSAVSPSAPPTASALVLYVESPAARAALPDAISGRYTAFASSRTDGILGQRFGSAVTLALLNNQFLSDTVDVFTGALRGDSLIGTFRRTGLAAIYLRTP